MGLIRFRAGIARHRSCVRRVETWVSGFRGHVFRLYSNFHEVEGLGLGSRVEVLVFCI